VVSEVIHSFIVDKLKFPPDKKFQRFFPMYAADFYFSAEKTKKYTIIELSIFEGNSVEAKKEFIRLIYKSYKEQMDISENDIEITIYETPKFHWGIIGLLGDELKLKYNVNI
jgi:phenylpyruvate tautomerase PptA (4-oxalocrotonate tautomerase family)